MLQIQELTLTPNVPLPENYKEIKNQIKWQLQKR